MTSDGSSELVRRDPCTLQPLEVVVVALRRAAHHRAQRPGPGRAAWSGPTSLGRPFLAGIDPASGQVTAIADARKADERHWGDPQAVMNGIAAMPGAGEFLLTGKTWRFLHHVRLTEGRPRKRPAQLLAPSD